MFCSRRNRSKFSNEPINIGGLEFDSHLEQRVYSTLIQLPVIESIELHKRFDLIVKGSKICAVEPDFTVLLKSGKILYADAKTHPTETDVSRLKFKLFRALYEEKIWILPREMCGFLGLCGSNIKNHEFFEVDRDPFNP